MNATTTGTTYVAPEELAGLDQDKLHEQWMLFCDANWISHDDECTTARDEMASRLDMSRNSAKPEEIAELTANVKWLNAFCTACEEAVAREADARAAEDAIDTANEPKPLLSVAWQTGRPFSVEGQIIVATLRSDGTMTFFDHTRQVDGECLTRIPEGQAGNTGPMVLIRQIENAYFGAARLYRTTKRSWEDGMSNGGVNVLDNRTRQALRLDNPLSAQNPVIVLYLAINDAIRNGGTR